jgi:hypothetical protein
MDDQARTVELPTLREHSFQSAVPIVGPLISLVRRALYGLTAKWGVRTVIDQQNQINQLIAQLAHDHDVWLVDQDRDLVHLTKRIAEIEIRQRYLLKHLSSSADQDSNT